MIPPLAALKRSTIIEETRRDHRGGPRKKTRHQIPWLGAMIPGITNIGAEQDGGDVGKLCEHELNHRAAVEVGPVEIEQREITGDQRAKIVIANGAPIAAAQLEKILRQHATISPVRLLIDRLGEPGIPDEMLQRKKFAADIHGVAANFFLHSNEAK